MHDNIRLARKGDIPALCDIWQQCFSDGREYIELFYQNNFERIKTYALFSDGKPVSMLHLIDADIVCKEKNQPAKFIYATGTLPSYRKKGCMSALIKQVTAEAKEGGYALFLKPSSPSTAEFYKSFGFEERAALNLITIVSDEKQSLSPFELSFSDYNRMREAAFGEIPHIKWGDAHIKWCIDENEYYSGKTLGIKYDNKDYFLMGYPEDGVLIINETDLSVNQLAGLSGSLCDYFKTNTIKAYVPADCESGENTAFALLYNSQVKNTYINLILI